MEICLKKIFLNNIKNEKEISKELCNFIGIKILNLIGLRHLDAQL